MPTATPARAAMSSVEAARQAEAVADGSLVIEGRQPPPPLQALIRALHDPTARITA